MAPEKTNVLIKILKNNVLWYVFSKYVALGMNFVASVLIAAKLGVFLFGVWSFLLLLFNIGSSCNFGIGNAATILLVQNKDDAEERNNYSFNAFYLTLFICLIPLYFSIIFPFLGENIVEKYQLGNKIYAVAFLVALSYLSSLLMNIVRVYNHVNVITVSQILWPVFMLGAVLLAKGEFLLNLLITLYILSFAIGIFLFFIKKPVSWQAKFSGRAMCEIFTKGFFLFLYNYSFLLIVLSTKAIISYYYDVKEFGYFSFGFSLASGVILLQDSIIFILFPQFINSMSGNDRERNREIIREIRTNYLYVLHTVFYVVIAFAWVFFWFLPQYHNSLRSFLFVLFAMVMYSNCFGYNMFLLAHNKEKLLASGIAAALVCNVAIALLLAKLNFKFEHIIFATLTAYAMYTVYVIYFAGKMNNLCFKSAWKSSVALRLLPFYTLALLLGVFCKNEKFLLIPLLLFAVFNFRKLVHVIKNVFLLIQKGV